MTALATTLESSLARLSRQTSLLRDRSAQARGGRSSAVASAIDFFTRGVFHVWRNRRYLTPLKLANMALVNLQCHFKTEYVLGRPYSMKIESTNICNTKCQLCPTGLNYEGRDKGKMPLDKFKRMIDSFRRTLYTVDLSMWGDPLIVPEIFDMIRHAHDRGVWTYISSNLHAFKPEKDQARKLVESGLDMLTCSLHGASQGTFEIYQPGKSFGDTLAKVRHILQVRNEMGSRTPVVQLNFVVTRFNEHERGAFQQLADELGCKAVFSAPSLNLRFIAEEQKLHSVGLAEDVQLKKVRDHMNKWLPRDREFVIKPYQSLLDNVDSGRDFNGPKIMDCTWPWKAAVVNWDGTVSTCCGSWDASEDMGNLNDESFASVWNGKRYRAARRSFKHKVTDEQAAGVGCANCPGFML